MAALSKILKALHDVTDAYDAQEKRLHGTEDGLARYIAAHKKAADGTEKTQEALLKEYEASLKLTKAANQTAEATDSLAGELKGLGDDTNVTKDAVFKASDATHRFTTAIRGIGGPLNDAIKGYAKMRAEHKKDSLHLKEAATRSQRATLAVGLLAKGLTMLASGADQAAKALAPFTTAWSDSAKKAVRGTALMDSNTGAMVTNQDAVLDTSQAITRWTGDMEGAIAAATGISETMVLLGEKVEKGNDSVRNFGQYITQAGKLAGMSGNEVGTLNKQLRLTMRMSQEASQNIFGMILDVQKFGLSGKQAAEVINENYERILSVDPGEREAFAKRLMESAALHAKAGVDFKKYAGDLLATRGIDRLKQAAMIGGATGQSAMNVMALMRKADAGDQDAKKKLLADKTATAYKFAGLGDGKEFNELSRRSKLTGKDALNSVESERFEKLSLVADEQMQKFGMGVKDAIGLVAQDAEAKKLAATPNVSIAPSARDAVKASADTMGGNNTVQEGIDAWKAVLADQIPTQLTNLISGMAVLTGALGAVSLAIVGLTIGLMKMGGGGIALGKGAKALFTRGAKQTTKVTLSQAGKEAAGRTAAKVATAGTARAGGKIALKAGANTAAKIGGKAVGKALLKKIPVIGALAGLAFGAQRAMAGDWAGAGGEIASGAASIVPGLGTAASVAIDAGLAVRDVKKAKEEETKATKEQTEVTEEQTKVTKEQAPVDPLEPVEPPYKPSALEKEEAKSAASQDFKKLSDRFAELADEMKTLNEFLLLNNPAGNPHYA